MKTTLLHTLCILFILLSKGVFSQFSVREIFKVKDTMKIEKYEPRDLGFEYKKIKMNPGDHTILNPKDVEFLKSQTVVEVDLVYSDYPKGADFHELNRKRILELYILLPEAFNNPMIKWNIVKQTGVESTDEMSRHFHGLVVYYRPMPSYEDEKKEILDVVEGKKPPKDSVLLKVLDRHRSWKNMLVVADVTGSMSPYTAQMLFWIKANQKMNTFKQIVFFNDDEAKSTDQKTVKDQKGIWSIETGNTSKVIDKAFEAMQNGQHYENNIEALFYAIRQYPENKKNIVLIADNWETPCDMQLLDELKKEGVVVNVVICGVSDRLNTAYLDIAYATGGSVSTMETDLENIATIGEGKTISLGKLRFKMMKGRFIQV